MAWSSRRGVRWNGHTTSSTHVWLLRTVLFWQWAWIPINLTSVTIPLVFSPVLSGQAQRPLHLTKSQIGNHHDYFVFHISHTHERCNFSFRTIFCVRVTFHQGHNNSSNSTIWFYSILSLPEVYEGKTMRSQTHSSPQRLAGQKSEWQRETGKLAGWNSGVPCLASISGRISVFHYPQHQRLMAEKLNSKISNHLINFWHG